MDPKKLLELLQKLEPLLKEGSARVTIELDDPAALEAKDMLQIETFLQLAYANFISNLKELADEPGER